MNITMEMLSQLGSDEYPYHLTWSELNDPISVLQYFPRNWDLNTCRMFLDKHSKERHTLTEIDGSELKLFLEDLKKLLEAVYVLNLRFQEATKSLTLDHRTKPKKAKRKKR